MSESIRCLRVAILQPAIPHYRLGLFGRLAAQADLDVQVHGSRSDGLGVLSVAPAPGWATVGTETRVLTIFGRRLRWHPGQVSVVARDGFDVVVMHGAASNLSSLLALAICRLRRIPVIWWSHGGHDPRLSRPAVLLRVLLGRFAGGLLLYTQEEAERYRRFRILRGRPVWGLDNGVEYRAIRQAMTAVAPAAVEAVRARLPATTALRVLFCGRFTDKAALPVLIEALRHCDESVAALLIGDGERQADIERLAADLLASGRLVLAGRLVGPETLAPYFMASDVFVYPGDMGLSGIEALAFGLPVLTHDHDATQMPEAAALREGINSLRYRHGDAGALAALFDRLRNEAALLVALRSAAASVVAERFDIERSAARFVACLRAVAADSSND